MGRKRAGYTLPVAYYMILVQMRRVQENRIIPIPPMQTWDLMRNLDLRPKWDRTILSVSRDEEFLYYVAPALLGLHWLWKGEYITFEPPLRSAVRMAWGSRLRPFKYLVGSWILRPRESVTDLTMIVSFEPRLPLPMLGRIMEMRVKSLLKKSLSNLSNLAEQVRSDIDE